MNKDQLSVYIDGIKTFFHQAGVKYSLAYETENQIQITGNLLPEVNAVAASLSQAVLTFEAFLWEVAEAEPVYRSVADNLAAGYWTAKRARPIIEERSGGKCECGCQRSIVGGFEGHHVFFKSERPNNAYLHHPGNMAALAVRCHEALHSSRKRDLALKTKTSERLPSWWEKASGPIRIPPPSKWKKEDPGPLCGCGCKTPLANKRTIGGYLRHHWYGEA